MVRKFVFLEEIKKVFSNPLKYFVEKPAKVLIKYIVILILFASLIGILYSLKNYSRNHDIVLITEKFLEAVKNGDQNSIMIYSDARENDFNNFDEVSDILEISNSTIHETINSWFGNKGTRILDDILGISKKAGDYIFGEIMEYKILHSKIRGKKAVVTIKMTKLDLKMNIFLSKHDQSWIIDYRQYKDDFNALVIRGSVIKILKLIGIKDIT